VEIDGLDNISDISDADFDGNVISYPNFQNMITVVDDAKGLLPGFGEPVFITTRSVVASGLTTYRNAGTSHQPVLAYAPGVTDEWTMDGLRVLRSHQVKKTYPSPTSPSQHVAHSVFCLGAPKLVYLATFGAGIEILHDPFTAAATGGIVLWAHIDVDMACPVPESISRAKNILP
jgi:hypothetical protein